MTSATLAGIEFVAVDTETTGFNHKTDRIVELAAVRFTGDGSILDRWGTLINPEAPDVPVHVGASDIHGITPDLLDGAPGFADIVGDLAERCRGAILVAHNAPFDIRFLRAELERCGHTWPSPATMDTLGAARWLLPNLPNHKLGTVADWFSVTYTGDAHSAVADAEVCAKVHTRLLHMSCDVPWDAVATAATWPTATPSGKAKQRSHIAV